MNHIDIEDATHGRALLRNALACFLALVALVAAVNTWTYSYAASIPLVQSDAWVFLDTFVRKYLEGSFRLSDIFLQQYSTDTNLPLHKLVLLFHINHFHMDFKFEGLVGVASAVALVLLLTISAAGASVHRWRMPAFILLAWLALGTLSLNSSNVYTWPLVTMSFLNLLVAAAYMVWMARTAGSPVFVFLASFLLSLLLDEIALVVVIASVAALAIQPDTDHTRARLIRGASAFMGLLLVRGLYAWFNGRHGVSAEPIPTPAVFTTLFSLVSIDGLRTLLLPLGDSLVHYHVLQEWFPLRGVFIGYAIGTALALAHLAFWWVVVRSRLDLHDAGRVRLRRLSIALMMFFYGTVAGIALQRTPIFGIEYLHQPRYVVFYQLHLAALGLMAYAAVGRRSATSTERSAVLTHALLTTVVLAFAALQMQLSVRAWGQAKYLGAYVEGAAKTIGAIALDPHAKVECADILRVCDFPPEKRQQLMYLLQNYQLNVFNADFQALYRLHPLAPADVDVAQRPAPRTPAAP